MAFKVKKEKEILAMSKEEQIKYWEEFKKYYSDQKKTIEKKIKDAEKAEIAKHKKQADHAVFVLFGEMIKHEGVVKFLQTLSASDKNSFTDKEKADINTLMKIRKLDITFN